jgi:diacylglycerol kinase (ATP)
LSVSHLLVVNPHSAGGSTGREWQGMEGRLRAVLPAFDTAFTHGPRDATRLAAEGAGRYEVVVAVGGDGTVNEVVNGLVDETGGMRPDVALGIVPLGTGADFVRSIGVPHALEEAAAVLAQGKRRDVDVARARVRAFDGTESVRCFINEASVGMGAAVCQAVNQSSKRFGGAVTFLLAIAVTQLRYRDQPVSFAVDGGLPETVVLNNAWIANGCYSGGGIRSAPRAKLDDGLLDLVRVRQSGPVDRLRGMLKLRSGAFVELPQVAYRHVQSVEATAATPVPVEVDGEPVGTLPATFDLLPAKLPVIAR